MVEQAAEWSPTEAKVSDGGEGAAGFHLSDLGNAKRFARQHGENVRFCHPWGKWLVWDGKRWALDQTAAVERLAEATVKAIWQAAMAESDTKQRQAKARWAARSEESARIGGMLKLARSQAGVPILPENLDRNPWLLNVVNGTLELRTGELREHRRNDLITKLAPVEYLAPAETECDLWGSFLDRIFAGRDHLVAFIRRLAGYCLSGTVKDHVLPILYGSGSNGKSTLLETIMGVLGEDYSIKAAPDFLLAKRGESHPTDRADLFGKRLVVCVETEDNRRLAESLAKELTGGDTIRARRMREDFWQFRATHKIVLATNHKPVVRGTDHALWRRLRLIPFDVTIPDDQQDKELPEKLRAEAPGILRWCVAGCLDWQRNGLGEPEEVINATRAYRSEQDIVGAFVEEWCLENRDARARAKDLYTVYRDFCEHGGETPVNQRRFGQAMTERGYERYTNNGVRGVGLRQEG
ncbi:MAG: DNA primase family protein [Planctomycetota bacterium]